MRSSAVAMLVLVSTLAGSNLSGAVNATVLLSPDAVIGNTLGEWDSGLSVERMIDQSGLSIGYESGVTGFFSYLSLNPTHAANTRETLWGSARDATSGNVDFDLGSTLLVSDFVLWSDASQGVASSAIMHFNLYASLLPDFSSAIGLGGFTGELGPPTPDPVPAQVFSFDLAEARYIRLEILDNYGDPNINVGEVAFGVEPVPEPTTFCLFVLGSVALVMARLARTALSGPCLTR